MTIKDVVDDAALAATLVNENSRITASPHHRITASPHHRITASPHHRITASPHHRITAPCVHAVLDCFYLNFYFYKASACYKK
ncbi:hypothetical protein [Rhodoferax sp.]|uniref:hypothetical protein n=1 Tax=Rhodoferax sp. TaxID=50421 RepID=UPI0025F83A6A|nr:hypothetical protein [Rhodoferax sp.]MBU4115201.1 hypothetical protein [Gammaproteobacteria bacterium]